jgi:hypothetical protein
MTDPGYVAALYLLVKTWIWHYGRLLREALA